MFIPNLSVFLSAHSHDFYSGTHSEPGDTKRYVSSLFDKQSGCEAKAKRLMLNFTSPLAVLYSQELLCNIMLHPKDESSLHLLSQRFRHFRAAASSLGCKLAYGTEQLLCFIVFGLLDTIDLLLLYTYIVFISFL